MAAARAFSVLLLSLAIQRARPLASNPFSLVSTIPLTSEVSRVSGIAYSSTAPPRVFVSMQDLSSIVVVGAVDRAVVDSLPVRAPRGLAVSDRLGLLYVALSGSNPRDDGPSSDTDHVNAYSLASLATPRPGNWDQTDSATWRIPVSPRNENSPLQGCTFVHLDPSGKALYVSTAGGSASSGSPDPYANLVALNATPVGLTSDAARLLAPGPNPIPLLPPSSCDDPPCDEFVAPGKVAAFAFDTESARIVVSQPGYTVVRRGGGSSPSTSTFPTLAVVTRGSSAVPPGLLERYALSPQRAPSGVAWDSRNSRIIVATRAVPAIAASGGAPAIPSAPATLLVINDGDGSTTFSSPLPDGCGDVLYDALAALVYVFCGGPGGRAGGELVVFAQSGADVYTPFAPLPLPANATMGVLVSSGPSALLYIAAPSIPGVQGATLTVLQRNVVANSPSAPPIPPGSGGAPSDPASFSPGVAAGVASASTLACAAFATAAFLLVRKRRRDLHSSRPIVDEYGCGATSPVVELVQNPIQHLSAQPKRWRREKDQHGVAFYISEVDGETRWDLPEGEECVG